MKSKLATSKNRILFIVASVLLIFVGLFGQIAIAGNVSVRVEGTDHIWQGTVTPADVTITASDNTQVSVSANKAAAALEAAASQGGFSTVYDNMAPWGLFLHSIAGLATADDWSMAWGYRVNWALAQSAIADQQINDGDSLLFFYGSWPYPAPLKLEISNTDPATNESFGVKTTYFDDDSSSFKPISATVNIGNRILQTNLQGSLITSLETAGDVDVYATKDGYLRSDKIGISVSDTISVPPPYDNSSGSYDNSSGNYDNSSGNYDNSSGNYDNSSGNYDNSSGNYDNSSGYVPPALPPVIPPVPPITVPPVITLPPPITVPPVVTLPVNNPPPAVKPPAPAPAPAVVVDTVGPKTFAKSSLSRIVNKRAVSKYLKAYRKYKKAYKKTRNRAKKKRYKKKMKRYLAKYKKLKKGTIIANVKYMAQDAPSNGNSKFVVKIQKRVKSKARAKRQARYKKLYVKYRNLYRKTRNRSKKRRYKKLAAKYKKAYRKIKVVFYKTVKTARTGWTGSGSWKTYKYRGSAGLYKFYVYATDTADNKQQNIAKRSFRIK